MSKGWVLVTGGAKGLGKNISLMLSKQGYQVAIHYKNSQAAAQSVAEECCRNGGEADIIQGNFDTPRACHHFLDEYLNRFPNTAHLVNNASEHFLGTLLDSDEGNWVHMFNVNLHAPFLIIKSLIPSIKKNKGNIINIGYAGVHHIQADLHSTAYTISKTALWMMTRSLAKELRTDDVRVNMISPGYLENSDDIPSKMDNILSRRLGSLEEVAELVLYLMGPKGSYITGQNIDISGGVRL